MSLFGKTEKRELNALKTKLEECRDERDDAVDTLFKRECELVDANAKAERLTEENQKLKAQLNRKRKSWSKLKASHLKNKARLDYAEGDIRELVSRLIIKRVEAVRRMRKS